MSFLFKFARFLPAIIILPFLSNCVSVKLSPAEKKSSLTATFSPPGLPFSKAESEYVDHSWQSSKNGNNISYISDCDTSSDPTLQNLLNNLTHEIENLKTLKSELINYNSREALRTRLSGNVDGIQTQFEILIFKKDRCTYILNYAARESAFNDNLNDFNLFVKDFTVP